MLDDRRLTLDHFRAFALVAECGGFAEAAERLGRTQSALTHQIQAVEAILGETLFQRGRGHFDGLTEAGARFLPHARRVLGTVADAWRSVGRPALTGRVRLGVMDDFDLRRLMAMIARFTAQHPESEIETIAGLSSDLDGRLNRGEIDLAVVKTLFDPERTSQGAALRLERLRWIAGDPLLTSGISGRLPLVVFRDGCVYRRRLLAQLQRLGREWRIAYEGHSYANIRAAVAAGLGLALLPEGQIGPDLARITALPDGTALPEAGFTELLLKRASERPGPLVSAFAQAVEQAIGETPTAGGAERRSDTKR